MRADTIFRTLDRTQVAWSSQTRGMHRGTPWVSDEVIIANRTPDGMFTGARLCAVEDGGRAVWDSPVPTNMGAEPLGDGAGHVFAGTRKGLACVDAGDGHLVWETDEFEMMKCLPKGADPWEADGGVGRPALAPDGKTVYFGLLEGTMVALDADSGKTLWHVPRSHYMNHPAPVVGADGTVAVSDDAGCLAALTPDGHLKWDLNLAKSVTNPVLDGDGLACLGTRDGRILAVDLSDGRTVREFAIEGRDVRLDPVVDGQGRLLVASATPWQPGAGSPEGTLHCLETVDGTWREAWSKDLPAPATSVAVDARGVVAVACGERGVRFYQADGSDYGMVPDHPVAGGLAPLREGLFLAPGRHEMEALRPLRDGALEVVEEEPEAVGDICADGSWVVIGGVRLECRG